MLGATREREREFIGVYRARAVLIIITARIGFYLAVTLILIAKTIDAWTTCIYTLETIQMRRESNISVFHMASALQRIALEA